MGITQIILLGLLVVIILFVFAYLMLVKWEVSTRQAPKPPHTTETRAPHGASVSASTKTPTRAQWLKVWIMSSVGSTVRVAIALALIAGLIVGMKYMDVTTWYATVTQGVPSTIIIAGLILLAIVGTESYKSGGVEAKWITRLLVVGLFVYIILFFVFGRKVNDVIGTFQKDNAETIFNAQPTQKEAGRTYSSRESPVATKSFVATKTEWKEVSQEGDLCIRTWIADGLPPFLNVLFFEEKIRGEWVTYGSEKTQKHFPERFRWKVKEDFDGDEIEIHYQFKKPGKCM